LERLQAVLAGRYAVERQLGQGGMATVYLAHDLKHKRQVAVKVLLPDLAASVGGERFLREIEIAARLQHPHVLPVYDSGQAGDLLYYVMPFVVGESLADRIRRDGPLPRAEALRITREVASALDYAHRQEIVHRDIKPANILLSEGHAVVADFGIARALSVSGGAGLTQAGMAIGTPSYMSPEQAFGDGDLDGRSDIYALGCVLYEMLSGQPPYTGKTAQSIIAKAVSGAVPQLAKRQQDLQPVLARMVAKDPDDRFQTGQEVVSAIEALGGTAQRRTNLPLAFGVVALVAVLLAVFLWLRPPSGPTPVRADAAVIAVLPFSTRGPAVAVLGEGMVDLLATNLDGVGGIRIADPAAVLQRWRKRGDGDEVDLDAARAIGRDVEASAVLVGSVVEAGAEVRLRGQLVGVGGQDLASAIASGPSDSILALVDTLSLRLLREIWRSRDTLPSVRVAAISSASFEAIRHYLAGAQLARRAVWDSAITEFNRAVEEDSTFALAHVQLVNAYGWLRGHGSREGTRHLAAAAGMLGRLPERDQTLVRADQLTNTDPFRALDTLQAFVARYPDDATGWEHLGDAQYHLRQFLNLSIDQLYQPFERAIHLDPSYVPAYFHPLEISFARADSARVFQMLQTIGAEAPSSEYLDRYRAAARFVWGGRDSALVHLTALADVWADGVPMAISSSYHGGPLTLPVVAAVLDSFRTRQPEQSSLWIRASTGEMLVLLSMGRIQQAVDLVRGVFATNPNIGAGMVAGMASAGHISVADAAPAFEVLERNAPFVVDYLKVVAALRRHDPSAGRAALTHYRASDTTAVPPPFKAVFSLAPGLLAVAAGDTASGLAEVREALGHASIGYVRSSLFAPFRFQYATAMAATPATREEGIDLLRNQFTDGVVDDFAALPYALRALGEAQEALGRRREAIDSYSRFLELWREADPSLQPQVRDVRARLEHLVAQEG